MSCARRQALIDAPPDAIWELLGDPQRHPSWWPRVESVDCGGVEQGCTYRQVTKSPMGRVEMNLQAERLEDCRELLIRCLDTGTYTHWLLTEARGGTFVDVEFGMDPRSVSDRIFDTVAGKRFFRRWIEQSIDALGDAAAAV